MSRYDEMKVLLENTRFEINPGLRRGLLLLICLGGIGFIAGLLIDESYMAWQALLVNTIYFTGIALGGLIFSVIFTITGAHWGRPIKRLAEAMAVFFPIGALLFVILFFGMSDFFEWVDHDLVIHTKEGWLNRPFFIFRNLLLISFTLFIGWNYLKSSIRPDVGLARKFSLGNNRLADLFARNYGSQTSEEQKSLHRSRRIAPVLGFTFAILCTLLAFDWIMSIDQEWFSTMFGVQYAMSNLVGAAAALMVISGLVRQKYGLQDYISTDRYHDLAKLTFAGSAMWTYMVFSQVLVIWYGNIPEETPYLILRMQSLEWSWMFWLLCMMMFIIPFFGLMSRTACNSIWFSRLVAIELLVGTWLEKYFLIVPSIQENKASAGVIDASSGLPGFSINIFDISVTLGVFSLFVLAFLWFLEKIPMMPVSDKLFLKKSAIH